MSMKSILKECLWHKSKCKLPATNAASKTDLPRRFVAHLIVSSILSAAGLLSFALTGPIICRIAAIDPALEAFYLSLVAGWFWSLAWMWSLTFQVRSRR